MNVQLKQNGLRFAAVLGSLFVFLPSMAALAQAPPPPPAPVLAPGSPQASGREAFITHCAACHGTNANGGEFAPSIINRVPLRSDDDLVRLLHEGLPATGMPAFPEIVDQERSNLISFLRTLKPAGSAGGKPVEHASVTLQSGQTVHGVVENRSDNDLQLLGDDKKLYLLRKTAGDKYREVTSQTNWTSYNGTTNVSRYSDLKQITSANASRLQAKWTFTMRNTRDSQSTPVVLDGVMYVTSANECFALDAGSGRQIWHYQRSRTAGITGVAATGANRGVAIAGDKVFMATDNARLIALNRTTGELVWDTEMIDYHLNYNGTGAPLVVGNMVIAGIAGGDDGARGFLAAYDQNTGKELWKFWTVPARGEPGSETWQGTGIEHPGGSTWMTGSYDKELDTIYWPIGNPDPDLIGDDRGGDNLYTDSIVALDPHTGKLKWYFQFTPHDVHDFDAMAPSALIDANWEGKPRKLIVQANRNGYFYVLDRTNGKFLMGTPYTKKLTWATGLTPEGRPIEVPGEIATREGNLICPVLTGASNWYSSSYNLVTGLYYVQTNDRCGIYTRTDMKYQQGQGFIGGSFSGDPADPGKRVLRAFDIHTGKPVWEVPETGGADTWGGVISTAGGVVFYAADDGSFAAVDAKTGKSLWSFQTSQSAHSSPMTYEFDHKQYVVITMGSDVLAFGLPD